MSQRGIDKDQLDKLQRLGYFEPKKDERLWWLLGGIMLGLAMGFCGSFAWIVFFGR